MRLWTLHPKYLDARGLVALWREALLAQAVLGDKTSGYIHHPQLIRFRRHPFPLELIGYYLQSIHAESIRRGYRFDVTKIIRTGQADRILVTDGQLSYEWKHLKAKLHIRSPVWLTSLEPLSSPDAHPLFEITPGPVEDWEVIQSPTHKVSFVRRLPAQG